MTNRSLLRSPRSFFALILLVLTTALGVSFAAPTPREGVVLTLLGNHPVNLPGAEIGFRATGAPHTLTFLAFDPDPGPTVKPFGILNLGFSSELLIRHGLSDGEGVFQIECIVDCTHPFFDRTIYIQAVQFSTTGDASISNPATVLWSDPEGECAGEDLCPGRGAKPQVLMMTYTGHDCSATSHSQDPSKVTCHGDPAFADPVYIIARDPSGKQIWTSQPVALGESFNVDAVMGGASRLKGDTIIEIYDAAGTSLLQSVSFHTSCSQPLIAGDQYGGVRLDGFVAAP